MGGVRKKGLLNCHARWDRGVSLIVGKGFCLKKRVLFIMSGGPRCFVKNAIDLAGQVEGNG